MTDTTGKDSPHIERLEELAAKLYAAFVAANQKAFPDEDPADLRKENLLGNLDTVALALKDMWAKSAALREKITPKDSSKITRSEYKARLNALQVSLDSFLEIPRQFYEADIVKLEDHLAAKPSSLADALCCIRDFQASAEDSLKAAQAAVRALKEHDESSPILQGQSGAFDEKRDTLGKLFWYRRHFEAQYGLDAEALNDLCEYLWLKADLNTYATAERPFRDWLVHQMRLMADRDGRATERTIEF